MKQCHVIPVVLHLRQACAAIRAGTLIQVDVHQEGKMSFASSARKLLIVAAVFAVWLLIEGRGGARAIAREALGLAAQREEELVVDGLGIEGARAAVHAQRALVIGGRFAEAIAALLSGIGRRDAAGAYRIVWPLTVR